MLVPTAAVAFGLAFAAAAALASWYRRRWAGVWCGAAVAAAGWTYTAVVRAEMPDLYYPILEHLVGWGVMAAGGVLAALWAAVLAVVAWERRRGRLSPGPDRPGGSGRWDRGRGRPSLDE